MISHLHLPTLMLKTLFLFNLYLMLSAKDIISAISKSFAYKILYSNCLSIELSKALSQNNHIKTSFSHFLSFFILPFSNYIIRN